MSEEKGLLVEIAKARAALLKVYSEAPHFWPEDDNPIIECIDSLADAATKVKPETPEDCLAVFSITQTEYNGPGQSDAPLDEMRRRALEAGKLMF
jgi:hypothetical protein